LKTNAKTSILFVCLGNICRSPTAEGVTRHLAALENPPLNIHIDSAGTGGYHVGAAPDHRSQDAILAMDRRNLSTLQATRPRDARAELHLFLEYAPQSGQLEVPDPYYGTERDFELVLDLCSAAARGLIRELQERS